MRSPGKFFMLTAALTATISSFSAQAGEVLDRIISTKTMTLACDADYPPQSFLNDKNEMDGFDVAVAREIAKRLGAELKVVTPAWEIITAGGWGERWDISVGSMTPTQKRAEVLEFPAVYYYTPASFAVHSKSEIASYDDLQGKNIGACGGCTTESYLKGDLLIEGAEAQAIDYAVKPGKIHSYETDTNIFDDLRIGPGLRLDATLSPLPTIHEAIANNYPLKVVGEPVYYEPLAIAVDKGDPEFSAKVTEIVDEMRKDGTLTYISMKWYGYDYTIKK
ncbi:transporter substrate-binding domain-containing protein [Marinobacterium maritimum]|uniref:Transporter substrate-binding domain-containing protein n=2 Tax=Marinobacterium maritimum TaxID=500162 RepID=A0ABN1I9V4_9GAMM